MAQRKLKDQANAPQQGGAKAAVAVATSRTVVDNEWQAKALNRDWAPYVKGELPPAEYKEKLKTVRMFDGTESGRKETVYVSQGEARFKVSDGGELVKVYKKRGGTGTSLVYQFKKSYADTPEGKARKRFDVLFRARLRECGVPGA